MSWVAFNSATPKSCTGLQWSSVCLFVEEKKAIMYNKGGLFNYQFQQLLNIKAIFSILDFHFLAYKFLLFIIYELNSVRHCFSLLLTRSLHRTSSSLFLVHQLQFRFLAVRQTLPKAQRTRGLSSSFQSNLLGHITSSNTNLVVNP